MRKTTKKLSGRIPKKLFLKTSAIFMILLIVMLPMQFDFAVAVDTCTKIADLDVNKDGVLTIDDENIISACYDSPTKQCGDNGLENNTIVYNCNIELSDGACEFGDLSRIRDALDGTIAVCSADIDQSLIQSFTVTYEGADESEAGIGNGTAIIPLKKTIIFKATAKRSDNSPISREEATLNKDAGADGLVFDECDDLGNNYYECTLTEIDGFKEISDGKPIKGGTNTAYFVLLDFQKKVLSYTNLSFMVDDMAPYVEITDIPNAKNGNIVISGDYLANIKIKDGIDSSVNAYTGINQDNCAGLKSLLFYVEGFKDTPLYTIDNTLTDLLAGCAFEDQLLFNIDTIPQGKQNICLEAADKFDYVSEPACKEIFHDSLPPLFIDGSLVIIDANGKTAQYVGGVMENTNITAEFDEFHAVESIIADFTEIGGAASSNGVCQKVEALENHTVCTWSGVNLDFSNSAEVKVLFTAKDSVENIDVTPQEAIGKQEIDSTSSGISDITGTYTIPPTVYIRGIDNTVAPVPEAGRTAARVAYDAAQEFELASGPSSLFVKFNENQAGFESGNVFMDLTALGLDVRKADSCAALFEGAAAGADGISDAEPVVLGWQCSWDNVVPSITEEQEVEIALTADSRDDAGNAVSVEYRTLARVDLARPVINITPTYRCYSDVAIRNVCQGGDRMDIRATVYDSSPITAYAVMFNDANPLGEDKNPGACNQVSPGIWNCTWSQIQIPSFLEEGSQQQSLNLVFTDPVNHTASRSFDIEVLGNLDETFPNHWTYNPANTQSVPAKIDRTLATISAFEIKQFVSVQLEPLSGHASDKILRLTLVNNTCTGSPGIEKYIQLDKIKLFNNVGDNPTTPYLSIYYQTTDIDVSALELKCTFEIITRHGNMVTKIEKEPVTINIDLTGETIGEAGARIQREIDEARARADKWKTGIIGKLLKLYNLYKKICGVITTMISLTQNIAKLDASINVLCAAVPGPFKVPLKAVSMVISRLTSATASLTNSLTKINGKYCVYLDCNQAGEGNKKTMTVPGFLEDGKGGLKVNAGDIKDNLWLSLATLCIPGILNNIEKMRQIECSYARCMEENIPQGLTKETCDRAKKYAQCKHVYGSMAGAMLKMFAKGAEQLMGEIRAWLTDPIGQALQKFSAQCQSKCGDTTKPGTTTTVKGCDITGGCGACLLPGLLTVKKDAETLKNSLKFDEMFKFEDTC